MPHHNSLKKSGLGNVTSSVLQRSPVVHPSSTHSSAGNLVLASSSTNVPGEGKRLYGKRTQDPPTAHKSAGRSAKDDVLGNRVPKTRPMQERNKIIVCDDGIELRWVYVANLNPVVTEADLVSMFGVCGKITRVQLRLGAGCGVNPGVAIPQEIRGKRDRLYATVDFSDATSVPKALKKAGEMLHGLPVIVTPQANDLPEMRYHIQKGKRFAAISKAQVPVPKRANPEPPVIALGLEPQRPLIFNTSPTSWISKLFPVPAK
ncbi:hypothetical protein HGRIS_009805 [Hohenbuehelia grisea]|uniref:RRM domain-containing protein n=1 Tax=Hohenbuehelia grisea TaxID=104357 RepID=A0ABR3J2U3_9AGAR